MAEALTRASAAPEAETTHLPRKRPYAKRLAAVRAALVVVGLVAAVVGIALVVSGRPPPPPAWSSWRPSEQGFAGAQQIAEHVGRSYRLPGGHQLVAVRAGPLTFAGAPASLLLRTGPDQRDLALLGGDTLVYALCGAGSRCSIEAGGRSRAQRILLRREALELALYSFHYLKEVDSVAAFLPAPRGSVPDRVLLFRRPDVGGALERPLSKTLSSSAPSPERLRPAEVSRIERLTARMYSFDIQGGTGGEPVLILKPVG